MSIAASFDLLGDLLPLCTFGLQDETEKKSELLQMTCQRIDDFLASDINDDCACALLNLLKKAHSSFNRASDGWNLSQTLILSQSLSFVH